MEMEDDENWRRKNIEGEEGGGGEEEEKEEE